MDRESLAGRVSRHRVVVFVALAYALTWSITVPLALEAHGLLPFPLTYKLHYLGQFGPMLAALAVIRLTGGTVGLADIVARATRWRVGVVWWLAALSPILLFGFASAVTRVVNGSWPSLHEVGQVNFMPYLGLLVVPLWLLVSGCGEEIGWRGFLLPTLQQRRGALKATLMLWPIWFGWHIPYLFYVPSYREMGPAGVPELAFSILAGTLLLSWLYNSSGHSLLIVMTWHGLFNVVTASEAGKGSVAMIVSLTVVAASVAILFLARPSDLAGPRRRPMRATPRRTHA